MKTTLTGPGGLRIELDSSEIYPDDPGQGTPAMVYLTGKGEATYAWASDNGSVYDKEGRDIDLTASQLNWLQAQDLTVWDFIEANTPADHN